MYSLHKKGRASVTARLTSMMSRMAKNAGLESVNVSNFGQAAQYSRTSISLSVKQCCSVDLKLLQVRYLAQS